MQTPRHPFLNAHGTLDHARVEHSAAQARSEALRSMVLGLARTLRTFGSRSATHWFRQHPAG